MIKKFQIELVVLGILVLNFFVPYSIDVSFHNLVNTISNSFQHIYLKKFFIQITILGDSKWYFVISVFAIIVGYLLKKLYHLNKMKHSFDLFFTFGVLLFFSTLVTGLLTQLLKHLIGRARPNYISLENNIFFDFFNFNSEFHSFPSGHASTIFVVVLVLSFFIPKLKYLFIFLGCLVAFSRVVVGAHFLTDIVGGIVLAYIGFKLTKFFLEKRYTINSSYFSNLIYKNKFYYLLTAAFFLMIFLSIGSFLDIYLSGLFYYGKGVFLLQSFYKITIFFRKIIMPLILFYILVLPIISLFLPIKVLYYDYKFKLNNIIFLWVSSFLSLFIVVNLLLKDLWGRARPGDILQLDGKGSFTPWYQISDACTTNCSFVSGDASVGFSLIVLYFLIKQKVYLWLSLLFGFGLGSIRLMEGGHFLSDIIMAAVVVYLSFLLQTKYYLKKYEQ